jgi:hypothetical protein
LSSRESSSSDFSERVVIGVAATNKVNEPKNKEIMKRVRQNCQLKFMAMLSDFKLKLKLKERERNKKCFASGKHEPHCLSILFCSHLTGMRNGCAPQRGNKGCLKFSSMSVEFQLKQSVESSVWAPVRVRVAKFDASLILHADTAAYPLPFAQVIVLACCINFDYCTVPDSESLCYEENN